MKSLKTIGVSWEDKDKFPPAEFWKEYDTGEFNGPTSAAVPSDRAQPVFRTISASSDSSYVRSGS